MVVLGMATSDAELRQMRDRLLRRASAREQALAASLAEARADFQKIVSHIASTWQPKRIWQWGSLIDGAHFSERSDIDLALEGIDSAEAFFAILGEAERMTRLPVDIVEIERIHPAYAESIRARGRVVYGG